MSYAAGSSRAVSGSARAKAVTTSVSPTLRISSFPSPLVASTSYAAASAAVAASSRWAAIPHRRRLSTFPPPEPFRSRGPSKPDATTPPSSSGTNKPAPPIAPEPESADTSDDPDAEPGLIPDDLGEGDYGTINPAFPPLASSTSFGFEVPPPSAFSTFGASPELLTAYLNTSPTSLTLRSLLQLGGKPGVVPTASHIVSSARFTSRELPIRLARRVDAFRSLPFIVGSNPHIQKIARLYARSFERIAEFNGSITEDDAGAGSSTGTGAAASGRRKKRSSGGKDVDANMADVASGMKGIRTVEDNKRFTDVLEGMVSDHAENIPTLARGFLESKKYMDPASISTFLDGAIHSRIAIRLIAEQHLALTHAHHSGTLSSPTAVGIIDTNLSAAELIRGCSLFVEELCEATLGCAPELVLEGDTEARFVGVASHLTYCMTELLKNSYRATAERHGPSGVLPPIKITIARDATHLTLRIRDRGGGISPRNLPHIFEYTFTTAGRGEEEGDGLQAGGAGTEGLANEGQGYGAVNHHAGTEVLGNMGQGPGLGSGMGTLAGLGYGLGMTRIYAQHGRGSLEVVSLYGYGCDTFLKFPANPLNQT